MKDFIKNYYIYFISFFFCVFFSFVVYKTYRYQINNLALYTCDTKEEIVLHNNKVSLIYLINSPEELRINLMHLGGLFQFSEENNIKIYFVCKKGSIDKIQKVMDIYDINEELYYATNLIFWTYSYGSEPTLLIFKNNVLLGAIYGCKDWNSANEIAALSEFI